MAGESDPYRFDVDFKKTPGTLTLTATHIAWVPKATGAMDRQQQAMNRVINMLASKAGSERVSLKLLFKEDLPAGGLLFTFTNPTTREEDRKAVQDLLIPFVSANRAGPSTTAPTAAAPSAGPSTPGTPSAVVKGKRKAEDSPTPSGSGDGVGGEKRKKGLGGAQGNLRRKVLNKNPNLKVLHRELVLGGQITEQEFWDGREALLQAEELAQSQRPGRPSRLLDDRFDLDSGRKSATAAGGTGVGVKSKAENGPIVLNLSKELTREIFEEFPVVQDAYAKYVPGISETEFWSRYFTSQLWDRHRASVRQSAVEETQRKKDDIFDQYLEEPDWNLQPRKAQPDDVERFLDLAATEEDHGEAITVRDHTMQAGRERSALPLIRRFNDHSNKLLRAGGEGGSVAGGAAARTSLSNTVLPEDVDIYNEIDYEDLRGPAQEATIALDVQDGEKFVEEREDDGTRGILPGKTDAELLALASEAARGVKEWRVDFESVCIPTPAGGWENDRLASGGSAEQAQHYEKYKVQKDAQAAAMQVVKEMHVAANAENAPAPPFPETVLEQIRSCHNAATEFLRQYWSALLPTPAGALGTSQANKAAKAAKMAGYLRLTEGKVNAVVHTGSIIGLDPARIRAALAPTMGAVEVALRREEKRLAKSNGTT